MFDALRENAEKRMFEVIDRKIDELFDNVDINWYTRPTPSLLPFSHSYASLCVCFIVGHHKRRPRSPEIGLVVRFSLLLLLLRLRNNRSCNVT